MQSNRKVCLGFFPLPVSGEGCRPEGFGGASDWSAGVPQFESGVNCFKTMIQPSAEVVFIVIHINHGVHI